MKLSSPLSGSFVNKGSLFLYFLTSVLLLLLSSYSFSAEREDYDMDDDGLIEINDLADLDEIRNNLDGSTLYGSNAGCPEVGCDGFELTTDLDFDTNADGLMDEQDTYWNDGLGWNPIKKVPEGNSFSAVLEGNNHTIKGLYIQRVDDDYIGLFSETFHAEIRNINIDTQFSIRGDSQVGTLAGNSVATRFENISIFSNLYSSSKHYDMGGLIASAFSDNIINNCSSSGGIYATSDNRGIGGLVGFLHVNNRITNSYSSTVINSPESEYVGGLVGEINDNNIIDTSYATGSVSGYLGVGGLIGISHNSNSVIASYATGSVTALREQGGLIGNVGSANGENNTVNYSFATGAVSSGELSGGLFGVVNKNNNIIDNNYWATDSTTHLISAESSDDSNNIGLTLASLQCATSANEVPSDNGCVYDNANELVELPSGMALYNDWGLAGKNNAEGDFEPYWDFGTNQQLPVLIYQQVARRDSDADGIFDQNDFYPNIPIGDHSDMDADGIPDICNEFCSAEGMAADDDIDGDGLANELDEYPTISLNGLTDTDNEGTPDECDFYCEQQGMRADTDDDNDLIPDIDDAFPVNFEIAVDADNDGLADAWTDACDIGCRAASGIVLDLYLNDGDNDGLIDGEGYDTDLTADNGLPELKTIPAGFTTKVDNEEGTETTYNFSAQLVETLSATDVVDDSLIFEAKLSEQVVLIDPNDAEIKQIVIPSGRHIITWTAIDDAGNRSESLEQIINVYPRVRFSTSYTEVEENSVAYINLELTGPAPHYPISFDVFADAENSSVNNHDFVTSAFIDLSSTFRIILDAGDPLELNTRVSLNLPIAQDELAESREVLVLDILVASDEINGATYFSLMEGAASHSLEIKAENFDDDGDGILDVNDAFSLDPAASIDGDQDGLPDEWNTNCNITCLNESNLTLDLDDDNDGTPDAEDLYPLNAAVALDDDNDGLPDHWSPGCNITCQNNSGFTLDEYPDDSDNDGLINALDTQHGIDGGKPILISVPGEMSSAVNSQDALHAKFTIDMARLQEFEASDVVDSSLYYRPLWNGSDLAYENGDFELPIGRQVIQWVAIDDAGNRSDPMEQIINVYPEVKFTNLTSVSGEGTAAQVEFKLTGPSPVYPVKVGLKLSFEDASANGQDIQPPANDNNFISRVHYFEIETGQGNTPNIEGVFELPIASDGIDEDDETVLINILTIENANVVNNYFGIVENNRQHTLTITDENLAPAITLEMLQRGIFVDEVDTTMGEVIIRVLVNDPNGDNSHIYEWDLAQFGLNMEITSTLRLDPSDWIVGDHEISVLVSDNGNPVMTTELIANIKVIAIPEEQAPEEQAPEEDGEGSEEPPAGQNSDSGSSSAGALSYGLFLLLLLSLYQRQRSAFKG